MKSVKVFDEPESDLPVSINWVELGGVTPVKDQGSCGSCWSFAAIGALEGAHFAASGELLSFSEQQLIDCPDRKAGTMGCHGGDPYSAFDYFKNHFIMEEKAYPYTSGSKGDESITCLYSTS